MVGRLGALSGLVLALSLGACAKSTDQEMALPSHLWYGKGFAKNGAYPATPLIDGNWFGSWNVTGDANVGEIRSPIFLAPARVGVRLAGYPNNLGNSLVLQRLTDGSQIEIHLANPREAWADLWIEVPGAWRGDAVQFVAVDHRTEGFGWFAFQAREHTPRGRIPAAMLAVLLVALVTALLLIGQRQVVRWWTLLVGGAESVAKIFAESQWIRRWWWCVVVIALLLRKPQSTLSPFLWAEDGTFFLQEHVDKGLAALVTPYAGYLHTYIRLWVLPTQWIPFNWIPRYFMLAGVVPVLVAALYLRSRRFDWPRSGLFALAIPLAPAGGECLLNLVNSQWFVAFWPALVLLARPAESRRERIVDIVMLGVAGATGPFCILYLPLFWFRWLQSPSQSMREGTLVLTAAAMVQVFVLQLYGDPPALGLIEAWDVAATILAILGKRILLSPIFGHATAIHSSNELGLALSAIVVTVFGVAALRARSWLFAVAIVGGFLLAAPGVARGGVVPFEQDWGLFADRYFNVPRALFIWSAVDLALTAMSLFERRFFAVVAALMLVSCLVNFGIDPGAERDPWSSMRTCALGPQRCSIELTPPGWRYLTKVGWHRY